MNVRTPVHLPPESRALLERLAQERDAAVQRLDVAVIATKAALGVPMEWTIRNLDEGFVDATASAGENSDANTG